MTSSSWNPPERPGTNFLEHRGTRTENEQRSKREYLRLLHPRGHGVKNFTRRPTAGFVPSSGLDQNGAIEFRVVKPLPGEFLFIAT
jgi:hypothetical protein